MPEQLCIGGVGDGQRHRPRKDPGMLLIAPYFSLHEPPADPVTTSRYRRQVLSLGDCSIDVWIEETISSGDALLLLVEGYRPEARRD